MALLSAVLLTACSSGGEEENSATVEDCFLDIYVYSPGRPIVTRGDVGEIAPSAEAERKIKTLQIWVYRHGNGRLVSYKDTTATYLNEAAGQEKFQMKIDKTFADNPENVDVYVVANAASCGLTLGKSTTRSDLDEAQISGVYFGTSTLTHAVPDGGLPMSAVLHNQPITGRFPTLRIGTESEMATLQLTRAVSRLRFVLCRITEESNTKKRLVSIDGIQLNGNQIPTASYLIPRENVRYTSLESSAVTYVNDDNKLLAAKIPDVADPLLFAYETEEAQQYENLIDENLMPADQVSETKADGKLMQLGLTYFRESDKQLKGTIQYTYTDGNTDTQTTAEFSMAAPGDFLRNHSWIVYIYFMDSKIHVLTVTHIGMKKWISDGVNETVTFYNW
jgi:hypothetical protein